MMLLGVRSLCTILFSLCKYLNARHICGVMNYNKLQDLIFTYSYYYRTAIITIKCSIIDSGFTRTLLHDKDVTSYICHASCLYEVIN